MCLQNAEVKVKCHTSVRNVNRDLVNGYGNSYLLRKHGNRKTVRQDRNMTSVSLLFHYDQEPFISKRLINF